jgi:hypothetical protein
MYIYALVDPRDGEIRYVGKAKDLKVRLWGHLHEKARTHKANWIRSLLAAGLKPELRVLEETGDDWAERERWWIRHFRETGTQLTNYTDGGEGWSGGSHRPETIERIRQKKLGTPAWNRGLKGFMAGRTVSSETRARMSAAQRKPWDEWRAHMFGIMRYNAYSTGYRHTPEAIERIRASSRARGIPPEVARRGREAALKATVGRTQSPSERAARSASMKKAWSEGRHPSVRPTVTPAFAAHNKEALAKAWAKTRGQPRSADFKTKVSAGMKAYYAFVRGCEALRFLTTESIERVSV